MRRRYTLSSSLALFAALVVFVAPSPLRAADEPISEDWSVMRMAGADAGWVHTKVTKVADPKGALYRTDVETKFTINRLGTKVSLAQNATTFEREDGSLVKSTSMTEFSSQKTTTETRFENGKAITVTSGVGKPRESTVDCPPESKGPYFLTRLAKEKGFAPGTKYDVSTFAIEAGGPAKISNTVIGPEEVELLDGEKRTLTRLDSVMDIMAVTTSSWIDDAGETQKTSTPLMGLVIESLTATKERALSGAEATAEIKPDVFAKTMIVAKEVVPYPRTAESAVVRITAKKPGTKVEYLADGRQELVKTETDGSLLVRQKKLVPAAGCEAVRPMTNPPAELAECLSANSMVQSDEPEIVKIANEVAGAEKDAWKAAQALERWVHTAMTAKGFDVGFASALETCRTRAGDCSEHAVFLAALCRAAGIPARVVMGVEYIGGIWGGHAWNEVWIDDGWYGLDGTLGYGYVDPFHLAQTKMTLKDGGFAKEFGGLLQGLGAIDIEVKEVEIGDRKVALGGDGGAAANGRYENRLWGFSFAVPAGFEVDPRTPSASIDFGLLELDGKGSDGKPCEIEIDVLDTPSVLDWTQFTDRMSRGGKSAIEETTVDGRPARVGDVKKAEGSARVAFVVAGDALYVFALDRVAGDADKALFDVFLKSLDFDVATRNN